MAEDNTTQQFLETQKEILKNQREESTKLLESIGSLIKKTPDAKERLKLIKSQKDLQDMNRTLGGDLTKNLTDLKSNLISGFDGFLQGIAGPFGGFATSLTTGFLRRSEENQKNIETNDASLQLAKEQLEKIEENGGVAQQTLSTQKQILRLVKRQPNLETQEEEERESDQQHQELLAALKGLKVESIKDVGDDGGFFAGLGSIASLLGGIAVGLSAPGIFRISDGKKAFAKFSENMPKTSKKLIDFFGITNDATKTVSKSIEIQDGAKLVKVAAEGVGDNVKLIARNAQGQFTKMSDGLKALVTTAEGGEDAGPVVKKATKFLGIEVPNFLQKGVDAISAEAKGLKLTKGGEDAGPVVKKATKFLGIEVPNFLQKGVDAISTEAKGLKLTTGALDTATVGSKFMGIAKMLTVGVAGKALSVAGNPLFDAIAMGKDIFDIGKAKFDDDVKTRVKNEDIGAVVGGFLGGMVGAIGGPAGIALGVGLGNMAGEFIGKAMDDPEVVGAIKKVEGEIAAERAGLAEEITNLNAQLAEARKSGDQALIDKITNDITERKNRDEKLKTELANIKKASEDGLVELGKIDKRAKDAVTKRKKIEKQIKEAEERGDSRRVQYLEGILEDTEKEFEKAEKDYEVAAEKLKESVSKVSGKVAESSSSFFDKVASGGGAFGKLFSAFGFGMGEEEEKKYQEEQKEKRKAEVDLEIQRTEAKIQEVIDRRKQMGYEPSERTAFIHKAKLQDLKEEREALGLARGGVIVNRPTYLPSSGVVVGEHSSWSGKGAASGGIPVAAADGPPEAVVPLNEASQFISPMGRSIAGEVMNRIAMDNVSLNATGSGPTFVNQDNSVNTQNMNDNSVRVSSPGGQMLPGERINFVSKVG